MFEVLAFLYEHYGESPGGPTLPPLQILQRTLNTVGFEDAEIVNALVWLEELGQATKLLQADSTDTAKTVAPRPPQSLPAMRLLTAQESERLGVEGWGFLTHLTLLGAISQSQCELVIERAMASAGSTLALPELKLTVLMVLWSLNAASDALLADLLLAEANTDLPQ
jgi:Smg protein